MDLGPETVTDYPGRPIGPEKKLVLDRRGTEQSYMLLALWGPPAGSESYVTAEFLEIATYAAGEEKPFSMSLTGTALRLRI